jgi:hypothetical protein
MTDYWAVFLSFHRVLLLQFGLHQACSPFAVQVARVGEIEDTNTRRYCPDLSMELVAHNSVHFQLFSG